MNCEDLREDRVDICYWRKNWSLFQFISDQIAPNGYGDEQYGKDLPLSVKDLINIHKFEEDRLSYFDDYSGQQAQIEQCIGKLMTDDSCEIVYNADW